MWVPGLLCSTVRHPRLLHQNPTFFLLPKPYCGRSLPPLMPMAKALDEADVGISCFVSPLPGFRGVLKQRYADFIVNEVDCDGNVVHLRSFDSGEEAGEELEEEEAGSLHTASYNRELEMFRSLAGEADAELLKGLLNRFCSGDVDDNASVVLSPDADKAHRTEVHNFFKKNMKFFITDVVDMSPGNSKCVRVRYSGGGRGDMRRNGKKRKARVDNRSEGDKPFDSRGSNSWPEHLGKFLRFHLYKENKDTQEALGVIGKMLGIQQRSFGFAGTKDKRAVTTQRVTVFKQHAKKLAALNNRLIGIKIGDFHYVKEGLVLGQLSGNQFTIVLRGIVTDSDDTIKVAAGALGRKGFINYYGLQRFGSGSIPTHLIGAALLRGEWKVAVGLILDPRDGERRQIREAREYYKESGDVEGTLKQLPRYLVAERAILYCLKKCPGNNLQALKAIPRPLRMMYVHSYQSYLWNHAATMRVQKYGVDQVVLGDLVYCKSGSSRKLVKDNFVEPQDVSYTDIDNDDENEPYDSALLEENVPLVKVIKEEDLTEGVYAFEDVILPLPGSRVIYPENDVADVYRKLSDKDSISLTESIHCAREFSITCMTGGYRQVFQRPSDFSWELVSYTDDSMPLVETDLDAISRRDPTGIMENSSCGNSCSARENTSQQNPGQDHHDKKLDGSVERTPHVDHVCSSVSQSPQMALKLAFTLPASCYATMAIRELLKSSTSVAFQKTLNP